MGLGSICQSELLRFMGSDIYESKHPGIIPICYLEFSSRYKFCPGPYSDAISSEWHTPGQDFLRLGEN